MTFQECVLHDFSIFRQYSLRKMRIWQSAQYVVAGLGVLPQEYDSLPRTAGGE